jgi:hypothetical protein
MSKKSLQKHFNPEHCKTCHQVKNREQGVTKNELSIFWFNSPAHFFVNMVPDNKFVSLKKLFVRMLWEPSICESLLKTKWISKTRIANRLKKYLLPDEIERFKEKIKKKISGNIRFGHKKTGTGEQAGGPSDFCLLVMSYDKNTKELTIVYRALDLSNGFIYDLFLIDHVIRETGIKVKKIDLICMRARVFSKKGNDNYEKQPQIMKTMKKLVKKYEEEE